MDERRDELREEPVVERERTTVIHTGGGDRGGGGTLLAVLLLILAAVAAFWVFGQGMLDGGGTDVVIDVKAREMDLPKGNPPAAPSK